MCPTRTSSDGLAIPGGPLPEVTMVCYISVCVGMQPTTLHSADGLIGAWGGVHSLSLDARSLCSESGPLQWQPLTWALDLPAFLALRRAQSDSFGKREALLYTLGNFEVRRLRGILKARYASTVFAFLISTLAFFPD